MYIICCMMLWQPLVTKLIEVQAINLKSGYLSQMSYLLVVILELSGVLEVQYKKMMIIGDE